jgi:hypothetical protein
LADKIHGRTAIDQIEVDHQEGDANECVVSGDANMLVGSFGVSRIFYNYKMAGFPAVPATPGRGRPPHLRGGE